MDLSKDPSVKAFDIRDNNPIYNDKIARHLLLSMCKTEDDARFYGINLDDEFE